MERFSKLFARRGFVGYLLLFLVGFGCVTRAFAVTQCATPANAIVAENCLPGNPASEWDVAPNNAGDPTIVGFATDISVNQGGTVAFKINTDAKAYTIMIYRLGYYGGMGARKVATITPSVPLPQKQPACLSDSTTGLTDCGNWSVTATWQVPATATSGVYIAHIERTDTGGDSHIVFIVRNDSSHSDILYQTSDETWQAYNYYGNGSLYGPGTPNYDLNSRAYKVSYNRPFLTRGFQVESDTWVFGAEFAMIQWMEQNGYDVTYFTGVDAARYGSLITNHKIYVDSGHDEYWSGPHRTNVEAARDAGVNMAFFSGNEVFWKTRWENSIDGTGTPYRTLVCYKETLAFAKIDPSDPPTWTGTWRDPSFSPPADGGRPENSLTGTIFEVNGTGSDNDGSMQIQVPYSDSQMRLWRNTAIASLAPNATYSMPVATLGYEWDVDMDNGHRPAGLFQLSSSTHTLTTNYLLDQGATYGAGTATHHLTEYRAPSGALVFGAGTIDWSWGLNSNHDNPFSFATPNPDPNMQQATVNLFADMGAQPATLQSGLMAAQQSTDTTPPVSTITSPASGQTITTGTSITVTGTATDSGGIVAGVEFSGDGGTTWHPATGRATWSYSWTPSTTGQITLLARAVDDSGNLEAGHGVPLTVVPQTCPCGIWNSSNVPINIDDKDTNSVELGVKFRADSDGSVLGVRFYKAPANTGIHEGHLWSSTGTLLGTVTFSNETSSGWQQANFTQPIPVAANTTYIVSYYAPNGHYSGDSSAFAQAGVDNPPLHALANGVDGPNGVYAYTSSSGTFPTSTFNSANYWVDLVYTSSNTFSIRGSLSGPGGAGATVTVNGQESLSTTADSSGSFNFDGLVNGTYTITPSQSGVTFSPTSRSVVINGGSASGVNFTATVTNPLSISGTITNGPGSTVDLTGAATATVTADASGNYAFTGLLGGSYAVTPAAPNEVFTPGTQSVALSGVSATGINFSAQTCNCISVWQASTTPAVIDANDSTPVELGMKFRSDVGGTVLGVRFYKAATNTGTHIGHLWSSSGTILATVTFSNETASGWQQANFSPGVAVTAGTTYVISYFAPNGHYSADSNYFASQPADNPPLHALANGTDGPNGVYLYTSAPGAFPANTYASTNYWVDVLLATAQPYAISGTLSGAGAPGAIVQLNGAGSPTTTADSTGNYTFASVYPGVYSVSAVSPVGFVPATQNVTVSQSSVTGVNFAMSPFCPCNSLWAPTVSPATANVDSKDLGAVELGTNFSADNDGYILGVRFYKSPANAGPHVVNLWSTADGSNLGSANATSENPSGWQQVLFANPVPVSAHTTYLASYFAPAGHYSATPSYFATSGTDNAPLHAPQGTSTVPNGVFSYASTSTKPLSTYNSTNYWVDVLYATATTYTAAGRVTGAAAGTTLTLSGPTTATTGIDASGNYSFNNLTAGTYTITPSNAGISFSPASQTANISGAHALGLNFVASPISLTVSGNVAGAPNDAIVLSGTNTYNTVTDASGNYTFSGVANGSYTVTPGTAGFTVSPASQPVTVSGANVTGVNFTATALNFNIAGTITGGAGATVTLSGGASATTTADGSGNYSFANYPNGSYSITPAQTGMVFTPTSIALAVQGANITNANFTVPSICPCDTLWQPSTTPVVRDSGDAGAGEFGVKIRADQDGYIAGIRFYKSAANTGTHTGNLWSSAGTNLGTASFSSETASGWQQVLFAQPVPVVKNTTFIASYYTTAGHYAADSGFFTSSGVDTGPLHALANGVDGQNGVYAYGASTLFPSSSFNAANYWIDAVYIPTTTYTIAGTLSGSSAAGATVTLSGASNASVTADNAGNFSFNGLANGTYTVTPSAGGSTFSPTSQTVTINNGHALGLSFASSAATYTVSGAISGAGGSGATVSLTGGATATTTANASGQYSFAGLSNGNYTVTASNTGYVMTPATQAVTVNNANASANFSSAAQTFTVSGTISGAGGSGATVNLTGASTASTTANASGVYSFAGLANGSYTVTPTKSGFVMTPASQAAVVNGANVSANFSSAAQTSTLSGTISGAGGSGATVSLTGAATATTTANASGQYSFAGLSNGSYTVTPSKAGYVMTPASQPVTITGTNATANFSSAVQTFTLSGTISGAGGSGAAVNLTGTKTASTTANSSGQYSFTGLTNGSYTVRPTKAGYVMTPASQAATINGANATANFSSAPQTFSLSGTISGSGGSGATVNLTGTTTATVTANGSGQFTFTGLPNGSYTVTPSKGQHVYNPTRQAVTISGANKTGVNFSTLF